MPFWHHPSELMKAHSIDLSGKYASQITTSKHFFELTAHRSVKDNCHDMGLKVIHGLSADLDDSLTEKGQQDAVAFMKYMIFCAANDVYEQTVPARTVLMPPYKALLSNAGKKFSKSY